MRLEQLTFLRFLAAAGIVVFHYGRDVEWLTWGSSIWDHANTSVSFFFTLSGFILAVVYRGRQSWSVGEFYLARAARILPVYWLALFLTCAWVARHRILSAPEVVLTSGLIHAWIPGHALVLNAQAWSLSVEAFFYLLFPFLFRILLGLRGRALVLLGTGLWFSNLVLHYALVNAMLENPSMAFKDVVFYHPFVHMPSFVFGMASGLLFEGWRPTLARYSKWLMWGSALLFTVALALPNPLLRYHHNGLFAPLFTAFILGLAAAPDSWFSRLLARRVFVGLGEASYGVYILQYPLFLTFVAVTARLHLDLSPGARFVGFSVFLVFCSVLTFRFLEAPASQYIRAVARRRTAIS